MLGTFSRQAVRVRRGERGQAMALFLVVAVTLLAVVFAAVRVQHVAVSRIGTTDSIDAVALSAATWEARCLNLIAALNDGAIQCLRIIRYTCVVWAGLAVAAAFGGGIPAFAQYTLRARKTIAGYWKTAHLLIRWSYRIRKAAPYLVLGEVASLARKRNVAGILFPPNPAGPHDGRNTLELHVAPGPPITLADAMAPIRAALDRLRKIRMLEGAVKTVIALLDTAMRGIIGTNEGPIRMLEPENDFGVRQFVRFTGYGEVPDLPIPLLGEGGRKRVFAEALAEPYGGGRAEMKWKSRLCERGNR